MTSVQDTTQHPELLMSISEDHPNNIRILDSEHPIDRYTCLMHVFDLVEMPEYAEIAGYGLGRVYAGAEFVHWLLGHNKLDEIDQSRLREGEAVFYLASGQFRHVGISQGNDRIVSKWGTGHLYEHDVLEVPQSYGDDIRIFRRPTQNEAYQLFTEFAEEVHGLEFE